MSTVIKAGEQEPRLIRRLETVNVADHLSEAKAVLRAAEQKARELLEETQVRAEQLRKAASEEGYEAGFRRGYEAGTKAGHAAAFKSAQEEFAERQRCLDGSLQALIAQFEATKRDLFIAANHDVLEFAAKVAEKVTRQVGVVHRGTAVDNMERALRLVESRTDLVARISPRDAESIGLFLKSLQERVKESRNIGIEVDPTMAPGGCLLSAADCEVDVTLETQIEEIAALVVGAPEESS